MAMDRKVVEAKVDEVLSANIKKNAHKNSTNPSPAGGSMPFRGFSSGDMSDFASMANAQAGKIPLKIRIMTKLASLAMHPQITRFLQKKWWPLWLIVGVLFSGFILLALIIFIIWKAVSSIFGAYAEVFKKNS